jgi:hypothetical protein
MKLAMGLLPVRRRRRHDGTTRRIDLSRTTAGENAFVGMAANDHYGERRLRAQRQNLALIS